MKTKMKYWEPMTTSELNKIHNAACQMLSEQGIRIKNQEALDILVKAGAVRAGSETVHIPRELVEASIKKAPVTFKVYDRRGGSINIGTDEHIHFNSGTMTEILEYPGWNRRTATLEDVRNLTRIVDALDCINGCVVMVEGSDAPKGMGEILSCAEMLKNTTKFCLACPVEVRATLAFVEMAKAIARTDDLSKKPFICLLATILPGYEINYDSAQTLLIAAREGVPVVIMGGELQGMLSPATMAGSFVMKAAENLACLCILQTVRPGTPCLMDWSLPKLDMRTSEIEFSGPEFFIAGSIGAQLCRKYEIPSYFCPASDSKTADFQAGFEMAAGLQTALLSGISVTINSGAAAMASAASYELLVLHNEMLRNLLRVRRGMVINNETLALDVQKEVGIRGDFLAHPHTLKFCRSRDEFIHKDIFDATGVRASYEDPLLRAQSRWKKILQNHEVAVSEADKAAVDKIVNILMEG